MSCYILAIAFPWPETQLGTSTFPWPPGDRGLIDIGPIVGLYVMALAARLLYLGRRAGDAYPS